MSHIMRKPDFCLCDNKDADQLCSNCTADQRLCFCYTNSIIFLKSEISSFLPFSETVQVSLYQTWSEIPKTGLFSLWLIWYKGLYSIRGLPIMEVPRTNPCLLN